MRSGAVEPAEVLPQWRESKQGPHLETASTTCESIFSGSDASRLGSGSGGELWRREVASPSRLRWGEAGTGLPIPAREHVPPPEMRTSAGSNLVEKYKVPLVGFGFNCGWATQRARLGKWLSIDLIEFPDRSLNLLRCVGPTQFRTPLLRAQDTPSFVTSVGNARGLADQVWVVVKMMTLLQRSFSPPAVGRNANSLKFVQPPAVWNCVNSRQSSSALS